MAFYTDKASLFQTAQKHSRDEPGVQKEPVALPPSQIVRALQELNIVRIAAHSPQAKGRVARGFSTAQDRLVKGLRVAGTSSLEQANTYLEQEFLQWWNQTLTVEHPPLTQDYDLAAILSHVEERQVSNGYTVQYGGQMYQIPPKQVRTGMRGSKLRVEARLNGSIAMRFQNEYLRIEICETPQRGPKPKPGLRFRPAGARKSRWMEGFFDNSAPTRGRAIAIANATRGRMRKAGSGAPGQNRPSVFAFTGPKPPLGRRHQPDRHTAKDPHGFSPSRVSTDHSGASPGASVWGIRWGATPRGHHHANMHSHDQPSQGACLLCWKRKPFHFALTHGKILLDNDQPSHREFTLTISCKRMLSGRKRQPISWPEF